MPTALHELLWRLTDKVDAVDRWLPLLRSLGFIERATTFDEMILVALETAVAED